MSDTMTNVEIEDVLSSIRRLVSEDLKAGRPRQPDEIVRAPAAKLVLTPAFRVQPDAPAGDEASEAVAEAEDAHRSDDAVSPAADEQSPSDEWDGQEAPQDLDEQVPLAADGAPEPWQRPQARLMDGWEAADVSDTAGMADAEPDGTAAGQEPLAPVAEWSDTADAASSGFAGSDAAYADSDSVLSHGMDSQSLERTIAELEAAVAGIEGEFEPDGSELRRSASQAASAAQEDALARWTTDATDWHTDDDFALLDEPVTGALSTSDWDRSTPDLHTVGRDAGAGEGTGTNDAAALVEDPSQVAEPPPAEDASPDAETAAVASVDADDFAWQDEGSGLAANALASAQDADPDPVEASVRDAGQDPEVAPPATFGMFARGTARGAPRAEPTLRSPGRLHFGRDAQEETAPATPEPDAEEAASVTGDPEAAASEATAEAQRRGPRIIRPGDEPDEDEDNLFDDEAGPLADPEALREIVAEIIRQELQGTLGERITRSVRKLVRREIHRILESRDLE